MLYTDIFTASKMRGILTDRVSAIQITRGLFDATLDSGLFVPCSLHTHTHTRARARVRAIFLQNWPILDSSATCLTMVINDKIISWNVASALINKYLELTRVKNVDKYKFRRSISFYCKDTQRNHPEKIRLQLSKSFFDGWLRNDRKWALAILLLKQMYVVRLQCVATVCSLN